jgi:hypothetical protein
MVMVIMVGGGDNEGYHRGEENRRVKVVSRSGGW